MLSTFVRFWKTEDGEYGGGSPVMDKVDVIVPISYTTLRDRLTDGTKANIERAIEYRINWHPNASIAFSSCSYPFKGAEQVEDKLRAGMCRKEGIEPIIAEPMVNTVDEAMNIRDALNTQGIHPKCILIVTGELHSRSARYIWKKIFPEAQILITCIPHELEIQPDHIVLDQRVMWKWVLSNIKREIALRIIPLSWLRKIKHKPAS